MNIWRARWRAMVWRKSWRAIPASTGLTSCSIFIEKPHSSGWILLTLMPEYLDIAFFGSSLVSAYWNGAATYYRGIIRALAARGHRITFYEPDAFGRQQHRDISDPPWARVVVYAAETEAEVYRVLENAQTADLL